ncbi:MAG: hypothetical protein AAF682_28645 [Planctomycetota bacterium]
MPDHRDQDLAHFRDICFVIMPFGTKPIGSGDEEHDVDFDRIYDELFVPAIEAVELPAAEGGGRLRPVRTDREFSSGHISQEMFEYIEYSRFALADISAINANVFYELGARHRAHESGTAIFRQGDAAIPFDINQIKAFPYVVEPADSLQESKQLITRVLTESLVRNAWDSPIRLALRGQRGGPESVNDVLKAAEDALREERFEDAHRLWRDAAVLDPKNPLHDLKASAYPKSEGDWDAVVQLMHSALGKEAALGAARSESTYSEAYRELGIAQNKSEGRDFPRAGEESLRRAVKLAPDDFDAWASLGGVLRRAGADDEALQAYEQAVEVSNGHPYPLLMALKLRAKTSGAWALDMDSMLQLGQARGFRAAQVQNDPPLDVPWSFFDLAEISMYLGKADEALEVAGQGLALSTSDWMPGTFLSALGMLPESADLGALDALKEAARKRKAELES